jgi:hypothetical protein
VTVLGAFREEVKAGVEPTALPLVGSAAEMIDATIQPVEVASKETAMRTKPWLSPHSERKPTKPTHALLTDAANLDCGHDV